MRGSTVGSVVFLACSLLVASLTATAQRPGKTVPWIGLLSPGFPANAEREHAPLLRGLRDLGYVEGQNLRIDYRYAEEQPERLPALAAELVRLPVDVIVARGCPSDSGGQAGHQYPPHCDGQRGRGSGEHRAGRQPGTARGECDGRVAGF
jgi:hypothetical protein